MPDRAGAVPSPGVGLAPLERFGSEHGLSHNAVFAILEDAQGFMWFGTQDGLDRYDGVAFVSFRHDPGDPQSLTSNWITALLQDRAGTIWIGTRAGLNRLTPGGAPAPFTLPDGSGEGLGTTSIGALAEGRDGTLWVGTEAGLLRIDPQRRAVAATDQAGGEAEVAGLVRHIQVASDGAVWVLTEEAPFRLLLHRLGDEEARFTMPRTRSFLVRAPGEVWLGPDGPIAPDRLVSLRHDSWPPRDATIASSFLEDAEGRLWIGTYNGLWVRPPGAAAAVRVPTGQFDEAGGLTDEVTTIVRDRAGAVWVGTYGGVLRHDPHRKPFEVLTHRPGDPNALSPAAVSSIYEDAGGRLWVGTYGTGVDEVDRRRGLVRHHRARAGDPSSLCGDYVYDVAGSARVTLWVGTDAGFCSFERGAFRRHRFPTTAGRVATLHESPDGVLWLGTGTGLYEYDPGTEALRFIGGRQAGLVEPVDALYAGRDGTLWLASAESGNLASFHPATGAVATFRDVEPQGIWDVVSSPDGALWLASGAGPIRLDPATGTVERIRPPGALVYYSVLADRQNQLWFGTNKGLVRYDPARPADGFRRYDLGDGLGSLEFNRHAALETRGGDFVFGGLNGLTIFRPPAIHDNPYVPPVVFTAVDVLSRAGERRVDPRKIETLTLEAEDYGVSFEFAALNFTQAHKNRYAYMLEGFDPAWIEAGTTRSVRYTTLPPGRYRFLVRGANNDGVWNETGVSLAVTVLPPFWQTWWFRVAILVAVSGLLVAAHRARLRRVLALQAMRLRIASDLHDELGSDLSGIALASGMMSRQAQLPARDRRRLADVSASAVQVMEGLRDIVWCINPEHDTFGSLEQRMRAVAARLLEGRSYRFATRGLQVQAPVDMDQRRHLLLAFKELLQNVVRHAGAGSVEVELFLEDDRLSLTVTDDGAGFEGGEEAGGTGLKSLRRRAAALGGALIIDSRPGQGTRACLTARVTRTRRGPVRSDAVR